MQLILFSFAFNPETQELTYTGNIGPPAAVLPMAMKILQDALMAEALQRASNVVEAKEPVKPVTKKRKEATK